MATVKLTQFKSKNGANPKARDTLRTLGLGKIGSTTEREDSRSCAARSTRSSIW